MANMSYCRYRNTLDDLRDCYEAMQNGDSDEDGDNLSPEEAGAKKRLIKLAQEIAEDAEFYLNN